MSLALYIAVALVLIGCLAVLVFGVYIDHVRRQRRRRDLDRRRDLAAGHQLRQNALRPIGRPLPTKEAR